MKKKHEGLPFALTPEDIVWKKAEEVGIGRGDWEALGMLLDRIKTARRIWIGTAGTAMIDPHMGSPGRQIFEVFGNDGVTPQGVKLHPVSEAERAVIKRGKRHKR